MPRRRYRLFTVCSVIILFMLYRVAQNSWDEPAGYGNLRSPALPLDQDPSSDPEPVERPKPLPPGEDPPKVAVEDFAKVEIPDLHEHEEQKPAPEAPVKGPAPQAGGVPAAEPQKAAVPPTPVLSQPEKVVPEKKIHWVKHPEHWPIPEGEIIQLPSGTPKKIPKIQFDFAAESTDAKSKREGRLQSVRKEIERSWSGYRKHAWMHDELSPESGNFRDPFCGWAATLVDSLDTLWISGFKDEFDEAAKAVKDIDFTWTKRRDIPIFETTIRYLGGLLAAYDVSGGAEGSYGILLEKATELAEILMSIFDTPNRMPHLYYSWQPEYASQPHRTGAVGVAELATLSMEFTRLAQLTGAHKYYDAIDRITNALIEMQKAKLTSIPGLFPQGIDASGCKKIQKPDPEGLSKAAQAQLKGSLGGDEPQGWSADGSTITPIGHAALDDDSDPLLHDREVVGDDSAKLAKRSDATVKRAKAPYGANGEGIGWDCEPQGLIPDGYGSSSYSMGGSQDSAYEYFPKEFLLLGGLESKYQKLHEDTVEAVDKWLMFRPMIKDDDKWDILFPAKVQSWGEPKDRIPTYEMTHLTCFIGGMYGLGAKIFNRPQDLETAKKLTDGCVWGYSATPSGLMPEAAEILPCPGMEKCAFNETLWWEKLDPSAEWREEEVAKWETDEEERKLAEKQAASANEGTKPLPDAAPEDVERQKEAEVLRQKALEAENEKEPVEKPAERPAENPLVKRSEASVEEQESQLPESLKTKLEANGADQATTVVEEPAADKATEEEPAAETPEVAPKGVPGQVVPQKAWPKTTRAKPQSHTEYVKHRIEDEGMPPGFVDVMARSYILRPEAIESVWYMYRITGDTAWQDKGWTMFEATVRATRTDIASSAVDNVMDKEPRIKDEMESFWLAETLKYYYLLFAETDVISLDEWVLNTEAHPFRRPT